MDETLARELLRQLKFLNFWLKAIGVLFLVGFIVMGVLLYKAITLAHHVSNDVNNFQQKTEKALDVKKYNPFD